MSRSFAFVHAIAVVLAAGKGTRMRSDQAKVLHRFAGQPLILTPLRTVLSFGVERVVVVVGHQAESVRATIDAGLPDARGSIAFALQAEQSGTGHAVLCAVPALGEFEGPVLILSGDVPLLRSETLARLVAGCAESSAGMALASFVPPDPTGYGRILRDAAGRALAIREHKDASPDELGIRECNAGVYCIAAEHLRSELPTLGRNNAAGEIYLTDLLALRARSGEVVVIEVDPDEVAGVNTPEQLDALEQRARERGWI